MAHGILGQEDIPATTLTSVYEVPVGQIATVIVVITNRAVGVARVRLAFIKNGGVGDVANKSYVAYDIEVGYGLPPYSISGIPLSAGDTVAVYSNVANTSAAVFGSTGSG